MRTCCELWGFKRGKVVNKSRTMGQVGWDHSGQKRNEGLRKCGRCHFALGIGIKLSAKLLGCSTKIPVNVRKDCGLTGITLKPGKSAWRPISRGSDWFADQFQNGWMTMIHEERKLCGKHDALWVAKGGHAEFKRWYQRRRAKVNWFRNKSDPHYRLARYCRVHVYKRLKGNKGGMRTFALIGCNVENLKMHLQSQFEPWMTWDNYGTEWHVDHIKPCAAFDLSVDSQRLACFHYTNLRPLRAIDNLRKNSRFNGVLLRKRANIRPLALSSVDFATKGSGQKS